MLESYLAIPPLLGVLGLLVALGIYVVVTRFSEGDDNVKKIGDQIHLGAMTFMKTEYTYLSIFALVVIVLVWFSLGEGTAIAVLAGALSSSIAGWIGMYSATKANVRTATAASESGAESALSVAFYGGSIMGLCVASLGSNWARNFILYSKWRRAFNRRICHGCFNRSPFFESRWRYLY